MTRSRVIKGIGRDESPSDGDRVFIELGVRDGKIVSIGAVGIRTGITTQVGDVVETTWFKTGLEARMHGETFAGCETSRQASLALHKVFIGRTIDEAMRIGPSEVSAVMETSPESVRCITTVIGAVRNALIDVQVTVLAETTVELRRLRDTG